MATFQASLRTLANARTSLSDLVHGMNHYACAHSLEGRRFTTAAPSRIATIAIGYADGYNRALTNRGEVLIRGVRAPVIGTVCMDWIMLDVTHIPGVAVGDEVVLMGKDAAGNSVRVEELGGWAGTIPYEILTSIQGRVKRVFFRE